MATHAVLLNNILPGLVHPDYLGFHPEGEHERMPAAILCFVSVLAEEVVVRDVAVVAGRHS